MGINTWWTLLNWRIEKEIWDSAMKDDYEVSRQFNLSSSTLCMLFSFDIHSRICIIGNLNHCSWLKLVSFPLIKQDFGANLLYLRNFVNPFFFKFEIIFCTVMLQSDQFFAPLIFDLCCIIHSCIWIYSMIKRDIFTYFTIRLSCLSSYRIGHSFYINTADHLLVYQSSPFSFFNFLLTLSCSLLALGAVDENDSFDPYFQF